jgi:tetratricopeptide (TPR) repeat protein
MTHGNEVEKAFEAALEFHRRGELADAVVFYRQVTLLSPSHFGGHHLLGILEAQAARFDWGVKLLRRALILEKAHAGAHQNYANVLSAIGLVEESLKSYRRSIALDPSNTDAYYNLGNAQGKSGPLNLTLLHYARSGLLQPRSTRSVIATIRLRLDEGDTDEAMRLCKKTLCLEPFNYEGWLGLGNVHRGVSPLIAECYFERSARISPSRPDSFCNLGDLLREEGRFAEALAVLIRALSLEPKSPQIHVNCALVSIRLGLLDAALSHCQVAMVLAPELAEGLLALGSVFRELGQTKSAIRAYDRAALFKSMTPDALWNKSHILLLLGRFDEGWDLYGWRSKIRSPVDCDRRYRVRRFMGEPLDEKRIFVYAEQGFGDVIQFVRYISILSVQAAKVIFEVQPELFRMMTALDAGVELITPQDPLPDFDCHVSLLSLPRLLHTTLETIPWNGPYLQVNPSWEKDISAQRAGIGLVWAGNARLKRTENVPSLLN